MIKLLIATTNAGKQEEISFFLKDLQLKLVYLSEFDSFAEPEEKAETLKENALLKAQYYAKKTKMLTLADDTGLVVEAIPNKLGIQTHRYAQETDLKGYQRLIKEMQGVIQAKRRAQFITVVVVYNPGDDTFFSAKGVCKGRIAESPSGENGFGYDPVFIPDDRSQSFAQISKKNKIKISSRGIALRKIKKELKKYES